MSDLRHIRRDYQREPLEAGSLGDDPIAALSHWLADAVAQGVEEPTAMTLATVGADGAPSARIVLLKELDAEGLVFFTDYRSRKGRELEHDPRAAAVLFWKPLERQVRVTGRTVRIGEAASAAYFSERPIGSRLGAWASHQGSEIPDRAMLERAVEEFRRRFGDDVPLPPHWGGIRLIPGTIEFWQGRPDRLHDRFLFTRTETGWHRVRLSP